MNRLDEEGPSALVQLAEPVNKFPDFVRYIVQQLKTLCPILGKVKIAQILARAGLHLGATTVGRMLKAKPGPLTPREGGGTAGSKSPTERIVTDKGGQFWCGAFKNWCKRRQIRPRARGPPT